MEQNVSARFFSLVLFYLDLNVIVELKLKVEINFFSNYYLERMEFPTNFWNSVFPVSKCSCSIDQKNAVWCNLVIEELSFHQENVVVWIDLSCRNFQQLVHFGF